MVILSCNTMKSTANALHGIQIGHFYCTALYCTVLLITNYALYIILFCYCYNWLPRYVVALM